MKNKVLIGLSLLFSISFGSSGTLLAVQEKALSPDNTRVNKQLQRNKEATAEQQSENASDRNITQGIRQAIVKNKALSQYAHNVKIIANNGMVTLKGPVRTEREKTIIRKTAARVAGKDKVNDEIEVTPSTHSQ
jgi:hyperosmotically inducible periplasmic protein